MPNRDIQIQWGYIRKKDASKQISKVYNIQEMIKSYILYRNPNPRPWQNT